MHADPTPSLPLVVDLDGTLLRTDLLVETANQFLTRQPLKAYKLFVWLIEGKATLKARLAEQANIDAQALPYNVALLEWLQAEKDKGRSLVLATASHKILATQVATHLNIFESVFATDEKTNLAGPAKRDALLQIYGPSGFEYVGNELADIAIWQVAKTAHVVSPSKILKAKLERLGNLGKVFHGPSTGQSAALLAAMRPHQWMKNLLVFIPLFLAHQYSDTDQFTAAITTFVIFGLAASSAYLLNDLVDIQEDRHHPTKRLRAIASGKLSLLVSWAIFPVLIFLALLLAIVGIERPAPFTGVIALYYLLTITYSLWLKRIVFIDVLTLASLYTLRLIAGALAIGVGVSFWLLSFSIFVFLSLALIKRYSELSNALQTDRTRSIRARGYESKDLEMIATLGASAAYTSVLVLALYIQDGRTASLYLSPALLWLACPLFLYWISRAWLITNRGQMNEDPVSFAIKDRISWVVVGLFATVFAVAKVGL